MIFTFINIPHQNWNWHKCRQFLYVQLRVFRHFRSDLRGMAIKATCHRHSLRSKTNWRKVAIVDFVRQNVRKSRQSRQRHSLRSGQNCPFCPALVAVLATLVEAFHANVPRIWCQVCVIGGGAPISLSPTVFAQPSISIFRYCLSLRSSYKIFRGECETFVRTFVSILRG